MDQAQLLELAKQTVTFLSPLLATAAGDTLTDATKQLARRTWSMLQRRFKGDSEAESDLSQYVKRPDNQRRQEMITDHLVTRLGQDQAAIAELQQLVEEARRLSLLPQTPSRSHNQTIRDNAQVGMAVSGDVHGGINTGPVNFGNQHSVNTGGGAYVGGGVNTGGGDFVGGNKNVRGDEVRGNKIDARGSQGFINNASGPLSQNWGAQPAPGGNTAPASSTTDATATGTRAFGSESGSQVTLPAKLSISPTVQLDTSTQLGVRVAYVPPSLAGGSPIEVVLEARGFEVEGGARQALNVAADGSASAQWSLTARKRGPQALRVDFVQGAQVLDTAFAATRIATAADLQAPAPVFDVSQPAPSVDLELRISTTANDERELRFVLHSPNHAAPFHNESMGSIRLQYMPRETLRWVYDELSRMARGKPAAERDVVYQQERLGKVGQRLWDELIPPELKAAYWKLAPQIQSLQITSDEPWIPWEMIKPYRFAPDGSRLDEPHFCERFSLARWLTEASLATSLHLQRVQPVAPRTSNLQNLGPELDAVRQLSQFGAVVSAPIADPDQVVKLFEAGDFHVLHVAAHGGFDSSQPDNAAITLGSGPLKPSDITAWFDGEHRARPLVMLNACHGARADFAFTGLGGWADRLVRHVQVGAFVGAAWEVHDRLALLFAQSFYTALLRDAEPIGEAFRQARRVVRDAEPSNSTWLAYVLYANPLARAVVQDKG